MDENIIPGWNKVRLVLHLAAGGKGLDFSVFPSYHAAWMPKGQATRRPGAAAL